MLSDIFHPVLQKLYQMEESVPFKSVMLPVPREVNINVPPMDLSDVEARLILNLYEDPWRFIDDVWTLFNNAWLYNKESSKVYQFCSEIARVFESETNKIMRSLGYCCGRRYTFEPVTLECCVKKSCSISRNAKYYAYKNKCTVCCACFVEIEGDAIPCVIDYVHQTLRKDQFIQTKNDSFELEPFVVCSECGLKVHKICVLYIKSLEKEKFICDSCDHCARGRREKLCEKYSAKRLPETELSRFIQNRIDRFLKRRSITSACLTIRVVASSRKSTAVKNSLMKWLSACGALAEKFPYTAKTILTFYEIDRIDVAIFALHVQEYDSTCPEPNSRRVYISYLDSVNFFEPKESRTDLYYEILLAYMDYIKQLGYKAVHVWACPPPAGDDYIFYRHPPDQKSPDHNRLLGWYCKLLEEGTARGIILNNLDVLKEGFDGGTHTSPIIRIPYFENDFWPNIFEDCVNKLTNTMEEEEIKITGDTDVLMFEKHLSDEFRSICEEQKEVFFVFQLLLYEIIPQLPPIVDPDPLVKCDFMDSRDTFLIMCREKNYEFSSVRRAKYSSLALLYELHTSAYEKATTYTCNVCMEYITKRYHCETCDDFDLCVQCWLQVKHEHDLKCFNLDSEDLTAKNLTNSKQNERLKENCTELLTHARLCKDRNCENSGCARIKRLISHFTICSSKTKNTCVLCTELLTMCWQHAKYCKTKVCVVPTCDRIKVKLAKRS